MGGALCVVVVGLLYSRLAWTSVDGGERRWYRPSAWRDYANSMVPKNASARVAQIERREVNASARLFDLEAAEAAVEARVAALEKGGGGAGGGGGGGGGAEASSEALANLTAEVARVSAGLAALETRVAAGEAREKADVEDLESKQASEDAGFRSYADKAASDAEGRLNAKIQSLEESLGEYREATGVKLDNERDLIYHWIAGTFTLLCWLIAAAGAFSHSRAFAFPEVQRKILALLWMPPIYSGCCWLSLLYPLAAPGLSMVRDGYEAYTIWVFVSFLVSVLGEVDDADDPEDRHAPSKRPAPLPRRPGRGVARRDFDRTKYAVVVAKLADDDASGAHALPRAFWPPPCCGRKPPAKRFLRQCMVAVLQFVLFKPLLAVVDYVLARAGKG